MEQVSQGESLSLLRSRAMRNGALTFCAYLLIMSINSLLDPESSHHVYRVMFPPDLYPWIPTTVVLVLNFAVYAYFAWLFITLIRGSQCAEERLVLAAFATGLGFGLLTNLANVAAVTIGRYGDFAMQAIATAAAARLVMTHRNDADSEAMEQPDSGERGFLTTAALFIAATLLATAGTMLVVAMALRLLYPTAHVLMPTITKASVNGLNFLPYFPLQIGVALALGFLLSRHFKSRAVIFVWVIPLAITLLYIFTYQPASVLENRWITVLSRLAGTRCRPPDCYDQAFVVAPLYAAVAFSFGSWLRVRSTAERLRSGNPPDPSLSANC